MTKVPDEQSLLHRTPTVLETKVDGEVILMSMESGFCYGLDAIGSEIWTELQRPSTVSQLQSLCRDRYTGVAAIMDADVEELLSKLLTEGLIEAVA